jgi:hypothetical protein
VLSNEAHARVWNKAADELGRRATADDIEKRALEIDPSGAESYKQVADALDPRRVRG